MVRLIDEWLVGSGLEEFGGFGKPEAGLVGFDDGDRGVGGVGLKRFGLEDEGAGCAGEGFGGGGGVFGKDEMMGGGCIGAFDAGELNLRGSLRQFAAQLFDQFA